MLIVKKMYTELKQVKNIDLTYSLINVNLTGFESLNVKKVIRNLSNNFA